MQPLDSHNRSALIEIIEDRHGKRSTIITAQLPVVQWHDVIGEKTIADYPHFFIMQRKTYA
jgi:DNA replication protein DnaC